MLPARLVGQGDARGAPAASPPAPPVTRSWIRWASASRTSTAWARIARPTTTSPSTRRACSTAWRSRTRRRSAKVLRNHPQAASCFVSKLYEQAQGRRAARRSTIPSMASLSQQFETSGHQRRPVAARHRVERRLSLRRNRHQVTEGGEHMSRAVLRSLSHSSSERSFAAWSRADRCHAPLPRLAGMLNGNGTAYASGAALPLRYGTWFFGNGINPPEWVPADHGCGQRVDAQHGAHAAAAREVVSAGHHRADQQDPTRPGAQRAPRRRADGRERGGGGCAAAFHRSIAGSDPQRGVHARLPNGLHVGISNTSGAGALD